MGQCVCCRGALVFHRRYDFKSKVFRGIYSDPNVYRCSGCELVQADCSRVDNGALTRYYARDYRMVAKIGSVRDEGSATYYEARGRALAKLARKHLPRVPSSIFELGSGYGFNLEAMAAEFPGAKLFTDELDTSVERRISVEARSLSAGPYDVVVLSHVLEHFTDPKAVILEAVSAVSADGIVVVEVPNDIDGIIPANGPDEPHLTFFTRGTLSRLLGEVPQAQVMDVFTVGPNVRRRTLRNIVLSKAQRGILESPFANLLASVRRRRMSAIDLTSPNPNGRFLRAVLKRA